KFKVCRKIKCNQKVSFYFSMVTFYFSADNFLTDIGMKYNYKKLQILAGIRNLFDKRYYTYQDSINDQYLVGNGRNYYVEFKYAF
ncbi:hemin uptake system outer membrane receptor, partial [Campylobacter jejuni subsp. jejuni 2008-1025]|uniref:TonB-dependent receptor n=1 Tax=Campylobacter jejuni TaxID=197 RepID=UPI000258A110